MGQQEMGMLADRLKQDAALREQFRKDPAGAAQSAGIQLNDAEIADLKSSNFADLSDDQLSENLVGRDIAP